MHKTLTVAVALLVAASPCGATTCSLLLSGLAFGIYNPGLADPNDTTATVQVICIPGVSQPLTTAYNVTIAGTGVSGDTVRSITFGTSRLRYQVYTDSARTAVWGNGTTSGAGVAGSVTSSASLVPASKTYTAYGRMAAAQIVRPGLYNGSLLVTVDY